MSLSGSQWTCAPHCRFVKAGHTVVDTEGEELLGTDPVGRNLGEEDTVDGRHGNSGGEVVVGPSTGQTFRSELFESGGEEMDEGCRDDDS